MVTGLDAAGKRVAARTHGSNMSVSTAAAYCHCSPRVVAMPQLLSVLGLPWRSQAAAILN
jgi:hypothetical protein